MKVEGNVVYPESVEEWKEFCSKHGLALAPPDNLPLVIYHAEEATGSLSDDGPSLTTSEPVTYWQEVTGFTTKKVGP